MNVYLRGHTPEPETAIVEAYLGCRNVWEDWTVYQGVLKDEKAVITRIDKMWKNHEFGCFEEGSARILATGISRSCTHQLVRHRLFSYKQLSMRHVRFVEELALVEKAYCSDGLEVIVPPSVLKEQSGLAKSLYDDAVYTCRRAYQELLCLGIPEEDARGIAPIFTETQIFITGNFRTWLHFLNMRTPKSRDRDEPYVPKKGPQWEIRELAWRCYDLLYSIAPHVFDLKYSHLWEYV